MADELHSENEEMKQENPEEKIPEPSPKQSAAQDQEDVKMLSELSEEDLADAKKRVDPVLVAEPQPITPDQAPLPTHEERTWGMLAHLSILLNLVSGFLGMVAAIVIYFTYKNRSRFVAYHAMQSFIFQVITWLGAGLVAGLFLGFGTALAFLIIPLLCLIPGILVFLAIPASIIYGIIGAVQVNNGEDFRYWQVGDWVRDILEPSAKM